MAIMANRPFLISAVSTQCGLIFFKLFVVMRFWFKTARLRYSDPSDSLLRAPRVKTAARLSYPMLHCRMILPISHRFCRVPSPFVGVASNIA